MAEQLKQAEQQEEFIIPDGIEIKQTFGSITRKPMYSVAGFEMPYCGSPQDAVRVYTSLKQAYENGYFNGTTAKKPVPTKAVKPQELAPIQVQEPADVAA